jgi:hypothetical protein
LILPVRVTGVDLSLRTTALFHLEPHPLAQARGLAPLQPVEGVQLQRCSQEEWERAAAALPASAEAMAAAVYGAAEGAAIAAVLARSRHEGQLSDALLAALTLGATAAGGEHHYQRDLRLVAEADAAAEQAMRLREEQDAEYDKSLSADREKVAAEANVKAKAKADAEVRPPMGMGGA